MKTLIRFTALFFILLAANAGLAQTTSFTYQGRLTDSSTPASGSFDLQFGLFDAASGGTQIATQTLAAVTVTGGIFTVQLDFGGNAFPGANRFLEISVRTAGSGTFIVLAPRQQISSTPYAIRTLSAAQADTATTATNAQTATNATQLGGVAASQYVLTGDARLMDARTPAPGSNNYIQNQNTTAQEANLAIAGRGIFLGGVDSSGGVFSININGTGVEGASSTGTGVRGDSSSGEGVRGSGNIGVLGRSSNIGVFGSIIGGVGTTGIGVSGESGRGTGVSGRGSDSGSIALRANGTSWFQGDTTPIQNTTQTGIAIGTVPSLNYGYIFGYDYGANVARTLALNHVGGNVGIGTTTPARTLHVNGRVRIESAPAEPSVVGVCFTNLGDVVVCGGSSLRLKTNVQPFAGGLNILRRLRPISFDWKDGSGPDIGLGAEDVAQIAPSLTFTDDKGEVAGVKYDRLNVLLINAIKEQQAQIDTLRTSNAALQSRLSAVEKQLRKRTGPSRRRR